MKASVRAFRRAILAGTTVAALVIAIAPGEAAAIDIPSQPLDDTLGTIARQANVSILFSKDVVHRFTAPRLSGDLSVKDAIDQATAGTGLEAVATGERSYIVRARARGSAASGNGLQAAAEAAPPITTPPEAPAARPIARTIGAESSGAAEIVITGYRKSLEDSADTKKNSTNFVDSIYAEDIGKFPDLNLTESLQRLPGVQIDRDTSGEGTYINVRGLSSGFTVTTINGFAVSTSSNGTNQGRGSSLDILPSEFFRRLTLSKSPVASMVEGGTAGTVDMQPLRAFDRKGFHINLQGQGTYQDTGGNTAPRAAAIVSDTFDTGLGQIGVLLGGAYAAKKYRSEIFNTVGYTTMNLGSACKNTTPGCNSLNLAGNASNPTPGYGGGAGATLTTVPTGIPSELGFPAAGSPLVECGNGAPGGTSGMSCQDLSYVIVPRLVRAEQVAGKRTRSSGLINLSWAPADNLHFNLDSIYSDTKNHFGQYDVMLTVRSYNNNIPVNFQTDRDHVLTSGTFANAYFLNQSTDARNSTKMFYRSLSGTWDITRRLHLTMQGMMNTGRFADTSYIYTLQSAPGQVPPVVYPAGTTAPAAQPASNLTPLNTGQYATYTYTAGDITPSLTSNVDLPNYTDWYWNSLQITPGRQKLDQRGVRGDLVWGDARTLQLSAGGTYTNFKRNIYGWNVLDCALRNACTSTFTSQRTSAMEAIPNGSWANYLTTLPSMNLFKGAPFNPGFDSGWLVPNFKKIASVVDLNYYTNDINPGDQPGNYQNTYSPRVLDEKTTAGYLMADGRIDIFSKELRYNVGVRYTTTTAKVAGIVNDYLVGGGSRTAPSFDSKSHNWLPSANLAYFITNRFLVRGAAARTVTRPNPADLLPTYGLSLDGDQFTLGNPALRPFYANNFDFGIEWYPRSRAVVTMNLWWKKIFNYPATLQHSELFPDTGLVFDRLSDRQKTGVTNLGNGDPNQAQITIIQKQNSDLVINLFGQEFQWIQPLDFLVKGFGFNANVTHIKQTLSGQIPSTVNPTSLLAGLAPWTYNGTLYYERPNGFSVRVSYTHRDANLSTVCPCNNIPGDLYTTATNYMDAQLTFPLPWYNRLKFTVQAQNLLKQVMYNRYVNRDSEPDGATYAGRTYVVGLRADF